ncbi:MAG: sulfatase-like hydrolase/transferase [Polyangiaceae bacterium]|nr:sulfatase-like hydrolase/transferase [Polyangiaceae bacterium]
MPSRQSFHSGRMASNIKAGNYESLGTYFSRVGYTSAWYGKQHWETLVNDFHDLGEDPTRVVKARFKDAGIEYPKGDDRLVEHAHTIDWSIELNEETVVTEQSVAFLEAHKNDTTPFFLGVSYVRPHFPFTVQPAYASQYLDMPLPTVLPGMYDDLSAAMKSDFAKYGMGNLTETDLKKCRGVYYGMIDCVDEQVGLVLQKLDELGLREKTIVIYVADHGEMMGQHGIWYKNNYFEGAARVPFIVSMPSSAGTFAKTSDAPVGLIDLFPTLCEACGLAPPDSLEGKRLVPILTGADDGASRVVVSENKRGGEPSRMIRTSDFKYCYYQNGFEQLYKVKSEDRDVEAVNLAADTGYASVKADLKAAALLSWNPDGLSDSDD